MINVNYIYGRIDNYDEIMSYRWLGSKSFSDYVSHVQKLQRKKFKKYRK